MFSIDVVSTTSSSIAANVNLQLNKFQLKAMSCLKKASSPIQRKRKPLEHRLHQTCPIFDPFSGCVAMLINSVQIMRTLPNHYKSSIGKSRNGHGNRTSKGIQSLKRSALSGAPVLACFRVDAPTYVVSDASPVGLGAILLQDQGTGERKPICIHKSITYYNGMEVFTN